MSMTQQEISFTNAFNANRPTLALFSKCNSKDELHTIRDSFFLGMASLLCSQEYELLRQSMIIDPISYNAIADTINTPKGLQSMITAARSADGWESLLASLCNVATTVNSDLDSIWMTLENGRLEWLSAINSAHPLKITLKVALKKDSDSTEKDEVDAKMVFLYAISLSIPRLKDASDNWARLVKLEDKMNPLRNYNVDLWDCRKEEWRPLDLGVQEAAERGGSSFIDAWEA